MDIDYRKPSAELVLDLIMRDNPDFPFALTPDNCLLGRPTAFSEANNFRNTSISVNPKASSGYTGAMNVRYRRLGMAQLFPKGTVILDEWYPTSPIPVAELCRMINTKYGTSLTPTDFASTAFNNTNGVITTNANSQSLAFVGQLKIDRRVGERPVDTLIPEIAPSVAQINYGFEPSLDSLDIANRLSYGVDFGKFAATLETVTTLRTIPVDTTWREIIRYLGQVVGASYDLDVDVVNRGGFNRARIIRYVIPNVNVLSANSEDFNRVAVISLPADGTGWFKGTFLLHYRV